ncbi:MAG TPA: hypothetical protein VFG29_06340 [Syntrophales bacterium]|nr:hypothetical protein [Syntrophales bacterium]
MGSLKKPERVLFGASIEDGPSALSLIACWNFLDTLAKKLRAKPLMCLHEAAFFTLDLLQICTQYLATKSQL